MFIIIKSEYYRRSRSCPDWSMWQTRRRWTSPRMERRRWWHWATGTWGMQCWKMCKYFKWSPFLGESWIFFSHAPWRSMRYVFLRYFKCNSYMYFCIYLTLHQVSEYTVYRCTGHPQRQDITNVVNWALNEDFSTAYNNIQTLKTSEGK